MANVTAPLVGTCLVKDSDRSEMFGIPVPGAILGGMFTSASVSQNLPVDANGKVYPAIMLNSTASFWLAFGYAGGATAVVQGVGSLLVSPGTFDAVLAIPPGAKTFAVIADSQGTRPLTQVNQVFGIIRGGTATEFITSQVMTAGVANPPTNIPDSGTLVGGVATLYGVMTSQIWLVSAGADTTTVLVTGTDIWNQPQTELLTLNGNTDVTGNKAFRSVSSFTATATTANAISAGYEYKAGLNYRIAPGSELLAVGSVGANTGVITADAGTVTPADTSPITTTTGDQRGLWRPAASENGNNSFYLMYYTDQPGGNYSVTGVF